MSINEFSFFRNSFKYCQFYKELVYSSVRKQQSYNSEVLMSVTVTSERALFKILRFLIFLKCDGVERWIHKLQESAHQSDISFVINSTFCQGNNSI